MCCRYVELPLARNLSRDEVAWVELHPTVKVVGKYLDGTYQHFVHVEIACSALDEGRFCKLYGSSERPQMCRIWPDKPEEQAPEGCVYLLNITPVKH